MRFITINFGKNLIYYKIMGIFINKQINNPKLFSNNKSLIKPNIVYLAKCLKKIKDN